MLQSANLSQALAAEESKVTEAFAEAAGRYGAHGAPHAASLRESVAQTRAARERDNAALLQQALESAQSAAVNAYADASRSLLRSLGNGRPLTTAELSTMHSKARALALRDFDTQAAIAAGEAGFGEVRAAAESQCEWSGRARLCQPRPTPDRTGGSLTPLRAVLRSCARGGRAQQRREPRLVLPDCCGQPGGGAS